MAKKNSTIKLPFPELLYPYSPVAKPMPPPPISTVCEGDLVTVSFSCTLVPYLLGLLEVYRYQDSFSGTAEEKRVGVGVMRELMEVLGMAQCGVPAAIPAFRLSVDCILEYSFDGLEWIAVEGWAENGANCYTGAPGAAGADGTPGAPGAPGAPGVDGVDGTAGEQGSAGNTGAPGAPGAPGMDGVDGLPGADGVCTACEPSAPVQVDPADWEKQACAMAKGLASYMVAKSISAVTLFKSVALEGKDYVDQVTDVLDAIPVFGAIVNNLIDLAVDMADGGDYDDIIGFLNDPDFEIQVACVLYCTWKPLSLAEFTVENVQLGLAAVTSWAVALPPGLPFLTFYGAAFSLLSGTMIPAEAHRRAAVHQDERSDDCSLLCSDCDDPVENCGQKYEIFDRIGSGYGTILETTNTTITVECGSTGYCTLQAKDINDCCVVVSIETITGTGVPTAHLPCGVEFAGGFTAQTPVGQCCAFMEMQSAGYAVYKITFAPCS